MTRVFKSRAEAEAAGWCVYGSGMEATRNLETSRAEWADVRSPLECTLADALEEARAALDALDHPNGGNALNFWRRGRPIGEHIDAALKAFRGEGEA